jgi:hypothetical protein
MQVFVIASWQTWFDDQGISFTAQQLTFMGGLFLLGWAAAIVGYFVVNYEGTRKFLRALGLVAATLLGVVALASGYAWLANGGRGNADEYWYCWNSGDPEPHHLGHYDPHDHVCSDEEVIKHPPPPRDYRT